MRRDAFLEVMTSASAGMRWGSWSSDDASYVYSQGWQVLFDHRPDCININIEVGMDKAVSCSCDLPPGNIGFAISQRFAEVLDRFANDFELPNDSALGLAVGHEVAAPDRSESLDLCNRTEDVVQKQSVALVHTVRASARMRCLRAGCNSRSVHRSTFTPSASSRSSCRPTICSNEVPIGRSTNKSTSLPSWSWPVATEPNTRRRLAPRAAASARMSSRLEASVWEGRMT